MAEIATAVSDSEIAAEKADDTSEKSKSPPTDDTVVHVKDLPITVYISSVSLDSEVSWAAIKSHNYPAIAVLLAADQVSDSAVSYYGTNDTWYFYPGSA